MTKDIYEALQQWQADPSSFRKVTIEWGGPFDRDIEKFFLFDYNLMIGEQVYTIEDVEKLDLKAKKKKELQQQMERLNG